MQRSITLTLQLARLLTAAWLMLHAFGADASVSCSIAVSNIGPIAYVPATAATNITQSSFTLTCTPSNGGSTGTYTFQIGSANAGVATFGANTLTYNVYLNSICSLAWGTTNATDTIGVTLNLATANVAVTSAAQNFWACVPGLQSKPAGTYVDTDSLTLTGTAPNPPGSATLAGSPKTFTVSILTPATCSVSTPTTVTFNYTSFQAGIASASGGAFNVNCTSTLPYTIALNSTTGTLLGLNYTISVPAGGTGNGANQAQTVSGSMAAGQSGTCGLATCSASNAHTVTVSY